VDQQEQDNFVVSGLKFNFFSPNLDGVVFDHVLFWFSLFWFVPEIFAIEVESCQKIASNFGRFLRSQILAGGPPNIIVHKLSRLLPSMSRGKV